MNTQMIRRLAIETDAWCDQFQLEDPYYTAHWEEKFAQLIVKECAKVLTQHGAYFSGNGEPYHYAAHLIEEHFGVKE